jgi:hypothetical protein
MMPSKCRKPDWARRSAMSVALLMLGGCTSLERVAEDVDRAVAEVRESVYGAATPIALPPASRPTYQEGQTFIFDRDSVRQVRQLGDGFISWGDGDRELFRTGEHFFMPRIYQDNEDRTQRRTFDGDPGALWPLMAGKHVEFVERRSIYRKQSGTTDQTTRRWRCEVEDPRMTHTPAGTFDSYRVTCRGYRPGFSSIRALSPLQVVQWDYAPSIGHYVRRESWSPRSGRRTVRALSAALPAELASPDRIDAVLRRLRDADRG